MTQTTDAVRRASLRQIQVDSMTWELPAKERTALKRFLEETLPRFEMAIHEERLQKSGADITKKCGLQALQFMLGTLVRNTTGPLDGETPESRETRILAETIKMHGQILGLHGEEQNRPFEIAAAKIQTSDLASAMHQAMKPFFPDGSVSVGEVTSACGAIATCYLAALPEGISEENVDKFCNFVRQVALKGTSA